MRDHCAFCRRACGYMAREQSGNSNIHNWLFIRMLDLTHTANAPIFLSHGLVLLSVFTLAQIIGVARAAGPSLFALCRPMVTVRLPRSERFRLKFTFGLGRENGWPLLVIHCLAE